MRGDEIPNDWIPTLQARLEAAGLTGTANALNQMLRSGGFAQIPSEEESGVADLLTTWMLELRGDTLPSAREALQRLRDAVAPEDS